MFVATRQEFGEVERTPITLPAPLDRLIGESTGTTIRKEAFLRYLASPADQRGRSWRAPLSGEVSKTTSGQPAAYFIIHDTSSPTLERGQAFPPAGMDTTAWPGNNLQPYLHPTYARNADAIHAQCVNHWPMSSLIVWASRQPGTTLCRVGARHSMKDKPRGAGACSSRWKIYSLGVATRGASLRSYFPRVYRCAVRPPGSGLRSGELTTMSMVDSCLSWGDRSRSGYTRRPAKF